MRYILLVFSLLIAVVDSEARGLKFSEEVWDFGTISEDGGDVSHKFVVRNDGSTPVVIYSVATSCGCTKPEYSRKPLAKGDDMDLNITFDPKYRPGRFSKVISVFTSDREEAYILKIEGDVTPRVKPLEERYPYIIGDSLRLGTMFLGFRAVPHKRLVQQVVEYRNLKMSPRRVSFELRNDDTPLQLHYEESLGANEGGVLSVGYYVESGRGRLVDTVDIYIDGVRSGKYISISGVIVE